MYIFSLLPRPLGRFRLIDGAYALRRNVDSVRAFESKECVCVFVMVRVYGERVDTPKV